MNDTQDPPNDTTDTSADDGAGATSASIAAESTAGAAHGADTAHAAGTADAARATDAADAADAAPADDPTDAADTADESEGSTSFYVRRSRVPTLGFWVALAIAIPIVVALVVSPFLNFGDLTAVANFVLVAAVFVGIPLAAVAAAVDAFRHRSSRRRGR
ncbi:MAG: hypothetical protein ACTIB2_02115 [Brachybacterium tyrofermentans]|uniref:hypothetical protein n=1 Tax=Brachybacterium tyrofermentans TaxID=47848 RepID=UPI003FB94C8C